MAKTPRKSHRRKRRKSSRSKGKYPSTSGFTEAQRRKVAEVMHEWKAGKLKPGRGSRSPLKYSSENLAQARAIALASARAHKRVKGTRLSAATERKLKQRSSAKRRHAYAKAHGTKFRRAKRSKRRSRRSKRRSSRKRHRRSSHRRHKK